MTDRPFVEEQVQFRNGDVTLAGTLVTPPSGGPHPAVVFIHGSGRHALDYYRTLAAHFARHGIAGLVYDKRGVGESTGEFPNDRVYGFSDLANDALAGLTLLRSRQDIDPTTTGLWGLSQGGWLGPLAVSRADEVAFLICVGASGVDAGAQMDFAIPNLLRADGCTEGEIKVALDDRALYYELVDRIDTTGEGMDELEALANRVRGKKWARYVVDEEWFEEGDLRSRLAAVVVEEAKDDWSHDSRGVLEKVTCPVLAIWGEDDIYVPVKDSISIFEDALTKAGNKDYTIKVFPGADHGLGVDGEHADRYLDTMTDWLLERVNVHGR